MKFRIILLASSFIYSLAVTAQGQGLGELIKDKRQREQNEVQNDKGGVPLVSNRDQSGQNTYAAGSILQASADKSVAYYQHVAKQHGWYVGIGPALTKEEASHLNVVYKLSNKNQAGHWMKLEAINGYGDYTTAHNIGTYIASKNDNDSTINADWKQKLGSVCQWELMPDGSGETVIVERAYDEEKQLIYNYQPVYISPKEIIGSYTDSWGLPAKMSQRGGNPANVLVNIQLDQWGNDSIIKLVDTAGNLLMNNTGSWIKRNICAPHGNVLENYALNQLGAPMNDSYGNCSWKAEIDEYGNTLCCGFFDAGGNPVRLLYELTYDDVAEKHYSFDSWHRMTSVSFFNGNNEPDTTSQGVHRIEYTYNDKGNILSIISRGLDEKPRDYGKGKEESAFKYFQYNKRGDLISLTMLGPDSTYLKSNDYYLMLSEYDGDYLKKKKIYNCEGSDTILNHYESYSPEVNIYFQRNQEAYIDSLDQRGNIVSRTYISNQQDPIALPDRSPVGHSPYARRVSTYQYEPYSYTEISTYYAKNGKWTYKNINGSPAHEIITTDSLQHTITYTEFSRDSIIQAHYQEVYDEHFGTMKYKQSLTTTGDLGRSGMNDALYFKTKLEYTPTGEVTSITSLNEFDEPAYACSDYQCYCYIIYNESGKPVYYDENGNIIQRYKTPSSSKAACIEVTSESGKNNGFKDGDILIRYGNWFYNHNQGSYDGFENIYAQMVFSAAKDSIEIWVMRHFPKENESRIIKLHVKGGTMSELGFAVHEIYYTNKEIQRYLRTFMAFKNEEEQAGRSVKPIKRQTKYYASIIVPQYTNNSWKSGYSRGWKNPMLFIAKREKGNSGWPKSSKDQIWQHDGDYSYASPDDGICLMSEDGIQIKRDSIDDYVFGVEGKWGYLTEEEHLIALKLLGQSNDKYPNDFILEEEEDMPDILKSQPSQNTINAYEMTESLETVPSVYLEEGITPKILSHIEDVDSAKVFKIFTYDKYRELTYMLDKKYFTEQIAKEDSIIFIHETTEGIDEVLYLSADTVVWAKGHMTHGSKDIIRKNLFGGEYNPLDKYNKEDLNIKNKSADDAYNMAVDLQNHPAYSKSLPILKKLCKRRYGPAYKTLARAYLAGAGVKVDTMRSISLYEKALKHGEPVHKELGSLYYKTHQYKSAIPLLKKDASIESYEMLGSIYENGNNGMKLIPASVLRSLGGNDVKQNLDSALYYYKKGKEMTKIRNNYSIGNRFYEALDRIRAQRVYSPKDFKELPSTIAHSMSVDLLYSKGLTYDRDEDYINAYAYLKAAADSLCPEAEEYMADYMEDEDFGIVDKQKAQEYRQRAVKHYLERAEKGDSTAYSSIAYLYEWDDVDGKGIDLEKAKYYYKLALQHNDFSEAKRVGDMYMEEYNYAEALKIYLAGAKAGQEDCMLPTAQLYETNFDIQQAIYWYRKCYQTSTNNYEQAKAKKALDRFGVSLVQKITTSDMIGVWIKDSHKNGKIFLPNGYYFGFSINNTASWDAISMSNRGLVWNNIPEIIKNFKFDPWQLGTYYINGYGRYVENVQFMIDKRFIGKYYLTIQINNNIMNTVWENVSHEVWNKLSKSDDLINHIMEKWDTYKTYLEDGLQHEK